MDDKQQNTDHAIRETSFPDNSHKVSSIIPDDVINPHALAREGYSSRPVCLPVCLPDVCLSVCLSVSLSVTL